IGLDRVETPHTARRRFPFGAIVPALRSDAGSPDWSSVASQLKIETKRSAKLGWTPVGFR
ncbi:MAG TPA: hypothetical protein VH142_28850, partial [Polyangiaceae bacterium]|nr:hypothetical protein [Polyangiaceae bacterium]